MFRKILKLGVIPLCLLMWLLSCDRMTLSESVALSQGNIRIALSQDHRSHIIQTKSAVEPSLDDFVVEIFNAAQIRLYNQRYFQAKDEIIKLNTGIYTLRAHLGDSLAFGFDKPYFLAEKQFELLSAAHNEGQAQTISTVAKLANVKIAVDFGDNLKEFYSEYYVVIKHEDFDNRSIRFENNETRQAYLPSGRIYAEVYAKMPQGDEHEGEYRYYRTTSSVYDPNDFVTFRFEVSKLTGNISVNIIVDDTAELVSEEFELDYNDLPGVKPFFMMGGESLGSYNLKSYIGYDKNQTADLSFKAESKIKTAIVEIDSPYLYQNLGLTNDSIDLSNLSSNQESVLKDCGVAFLVDSSAKFGYISFSGMIKLFSEVLTSSSQCASIKVTVIDQYERASSTYLYINAISLPLSLTIQDYDVWGSSIRNPKVTVHSDDIPQEIDLNLQYRVLGTSQWTTISQNSLTSGVANYQDIAGLEGDTEYEIRALIGNNESTATPSIIYRTEVHSQVANNDFEIYSEQSYNTNIYLSSKKMNVKWWKLYNSSGSMWWASNSTRTILPDVSAAYQDFKTYPTMALFSDGAYSGKSVMIATISVGTATSLISFGTPYVGELYLGESNDQVNNDWAKTSEGHIFYSRPSTMEFMYKFDRHNNPFVAEIKVLDANQNIIGSGQYDSASQSISSWTKLSIPIEYSVLDKKAASIRISFRSETATNNSRAITVNTLSGEHDIHAGSILYLDDIILTY